MDTPAKLTCAEVVAALERKYPAPKYATIVEFERVDLLVVGTWASTQWVRIGFEIKVSRTDWRRELSAKNDGKAAQAMSWLDHWYVAAPPGIVRTDELPAGWGLVEITARGVHVVVKAPRLREPPSSTLDDWVRAGRRWVHIESEWTERMRFAMLARRYDYRDADATYLEAELGDAAPLALDTAAKATGRVTGAERQHLNAARRRQTENERKMRQQAEGIRLMKALLVLAGHDPLAPGSPGWPFWRYW